MELEVSDYPGLDGPGGPGRVLLPAGELVYVRGESGAGKTRFLRRLIDLDPEPLGTIRLYGRPIAEIPVSELRRRVAYLPQEPARFPGTGRDVLQRTRELRVNRNRCLDWTQIEALCRQLEVDSLLDRPLAELSGGESRRLALINVLQLRPEVLLLDEPTSGLDERRAQAVQQIVAAARRRGTAVLWTTHEARSDAEVVWIRRS